MSTKPRFQSAKVPGLVMWSNGAIVRVQLDKAGNIERLRSGGAVVLESFGRVDLPGLEEKVFELIEAREATKT